MIILRGHEHDLGGGMIVRRLLPSAKKRMVGPFTFLDHMGPFTASPGQNTDVRPHPHIGLSTLTYLFEGRIQHHDSLDLKYNIIPGEVNWMTAGRGIAHSERTVPEDRDKARRMHGLQFWVALPDGQEEIPPSFDHYAASQIPKLETSNFQLTLVAGKFLGLQSPVKTNPDLVFAEFKMKQSAAVPLDFPKDEFAIYLISGSATVDGQDLPAHQMAICEPAEKHEFQFAAGTHWILIAGKAFREPRHMWWNLIASSKERIEIAKKQWEDRTFPQVPGDPEFIPAPKL